MKTCTGCQRSFPVETFALTERRGRPYRFPRCPPCRNAYQRARWAEKNAAVAENPKQDADPLNQVTALWFGPVNRSQPLRPTP